MIQVLVSWTDTAAHEMVKKTVYNTTVERWKCVMNQYTPDDSNVDAVCQQFNRLCTKLQFQIPNDEEVIEALAGDPDITTQCSRHLGEVAFPNRPVHDCR
jgi:hypothetical protein